MTNNQSLPSRTFCLDTFSWSELVSWGDKALPSNFSFSKDKVEESYHSLMKLLKEGQTIYGIHTYFGSDVKIKSVSDYEKHQRYLLNYLRVGQGPTLKESVVRRALRLQTLKVSYGYSGVHPETFLRLYGFSNGDSLPQVPSYGSLGASGDLIPMAHAVEPIFTTHIPGPRDVLALVNTHAMMASLSCELLHSLGILLDRYVYAYSRLLWLTDVYLDLEGFSTDSFLQKMFPYFGELDSMIQKNRVKSEFETIQVPYSFRCAPMVLSHLFDQIEMAKTLTQKEATALGDNPIFYEDDEGVTKSLHGGLFYALSSARSSDLMQDVIYRLGDMIDRQVLLVMDPKWNRYKKENLHFDQFSCKGIHQLISSLMQRIRGLSCSSRSISASCESNNQDIVPASMQHLLITQDMLQVLSDIVAALERILKWGRAA